jgi:hypothetical protein
MRIRIRKQVAAWQIQQGPLLPCTRTEISNYDTAYVW